MSKMKCAALMFGGSVLVGAMLGFGFVFIASMVSQMSLPSASFDGESIISSVALSAVLAFAGGILGAACGAASWLVAALVYLVLGPRRHALVQASAVGVASAMGTALVLWFPVSQISMTIGAEVVIPMLVASAGLAVAALLLPPRINRRSLA